MSFSDIQNEHIRMAILHLLASMPGYTINEGVLSTALRPFGHDVSRDAMRTQLAWLSEQGLLKISTVDDAGSLQVAKITARGVDVAAGRAVVPGVRRPDPEGY